MKIGAVINNSSDTLSPEKTKKRLEQIKKQLKTRLSERYLSIVPGPQIEQEIERMIDKGIDVLVIGGGDGTVGTAAQRLANTDLALAVLPLGTRNNFARDAGIPLDPVDAILLLDQMNVEKVDLGKVNEHIFINNTSLGLYPDIVKERELKTEKHGWSKWRAQIIATLKVMRRLPRMWVKVEGEEVRKRQFTPFLFVGNNEYGGMANSDFSRASISNGKLWLCMAQSSDFRTLLLMAWQITIKGVREAENLETKLLTELTVKPWKRKVKVAIDGEYHKLYTPLRFTILKKSLRLVIP